MAAAKETKVANPRAIFRSRLGEFCSAGTRRV